MDFDDDMDDGSMPSPSQFASSSQWVSRVHGGSMSDFVKWQSSQTQCAALQALIVEAEKPSQSRPESLSANVKLPLQSRGDQEASILASGLQPLERSSSGTRSRARPLRGRHSESPGTVLTPAPPSASFADDAAHFLSLLKGVKDRVDENERLKREHTSRQRQPRHAVQGVSNVLQANRSLDDVRSWSRGKVKAPVSSQQSLPIITTQNSDISTSRSVHTSVSMNIDNSAHISRNSTEESLLVPPSFAPQDESTPRDRASSIVSKRTEVTLSQENAHRGSYDQRTSRQYVPNTRPSTLEQPRVPKPVPVRNRAVGVDIPAHPVYLPIPPMQSSQPSDKLSRPPPLGMRRATTLQSSAFAPLQNPASKQKAFKPPLVSKVSPAKGATRSVSVSIINPVVDRDTKRQSSRPLDNHSSSCTPDSTPEQPPLDRARVSVVDGRSDLKSHLPSPSPPSPVDPDSSYGDISFDMDVLEEALKKYD